MNEIALVLIGGLFMIAGLWVGMKWALIKIGVPRPQLFRWVAFSFVLDGIGAALILTPLVIRLLR